MIILILLISATLAVTTVSNTMNINSEQFDGIALGVNNKYFTYKVGENMADYAFQGDYASVRDTLAD